MVLKSFIIAAMVFAGITLVNGNPIPGSTQVFKFRDLSNANTGGETYNDNQCGKYVPRIFYNECHFAHISKDPRPRVLLMPAENKLSNLIAFGSNRGLT